MADKIEWEVWYADGSRYTSQTHTWDQLPPIGVQVVRVWGHPVFGKVVSWGEAYYGDPATWKMESRMTDAAFAQMLAEAQADAVPPSQRSS